MAGNRKNLSERLLRIRRTEAAVFGDFIYDPGATLGPRTQQDFQLVYLFSGSADIRVSALRVMLPPGEMCLLRPGEREFFTFAPSRPTHHGWCSVRPDAMAALPQDRLRAAAGQGATAAISGRTSQLLELAFSIPEDAPGGLLESLACALFEDFLLAATGGAANPPGPPLPEPVRRGRDFIEAHYPEGLDLAQIGRAAGVAPKHLGKLFVRHLGITPIRQLWRVRTARGAQLLTETGLSLGEIAERVGCQNPFHFSRLIRQAFGVSPRQLRTERWNAGGG